VSLSVSSHIVLIQPTHPTAQTCSEIQAASDKMTFGR